MARKIVWTYESFADLEALAEYINRDSAYYAAAFVQEIQKTVDSLGQLSERGRIVPELGNPNIRELFIREYRLIYSVDELQVAVLGIIHGRRDLTKLWKKRN